MAVYVDKIVDYHKSMVKKDAIKHGTLWCHMYADTSEELIDIGYKIGMKPAWLQNAGKDSGDEHFDLTPGKRFQALKAGAIEDNDHTQLKRIYNENRN